MENLYTVSKNSKKQQKPLYSQQKQSAQIMNSLLPNSDLNWRNEGKPLDHSGVM